MLGVTLNVLNQKGAPALYEDIAANRPAAGFAGRLFVSTDTLLFQRDTGTAWQTIAGGGSSIGGSIAANQVAYGSGANTIVGSNNFTFNSGTNALNVGGAVNAISATLSGLTAGQVVYTGTGGLLSSNANFAYDNPNYVVYLPIVSSNQLITNISGTLTYANNPNTRNGSQNRISVESSSSSNTAQSIYGLQVYMRQSNTISSASSVIGIIAQLTDNSTTTNQQYFNGFVSSYNVVSGTTTNTFTGFTGYNNPTSIIGNLTNYILFQGSTPSNSSTNVTNVNIFNISDFNAITNAYGINSAMTNSGTANKRFIYSSGNATSYHAGNFLFGSNTDNAAGIIQAAGNIVPSLNGTNSIGTSSYYWNYIYANKGSFSNSQNITAGGASVVSHIGTFTDMGTAVTGGVSIYAALSEMAYTTTVSRAIAATNVYAGALNILYLSITGSSTVTVTQSGSNIRSMYATFSQVNIGVNAATTSSITSVAAIATQLYSDTVHQLSIGTYYGVLITDSTQFYSGNVTNRWGLYQEGASDINFINGELRMGSGQTISASVLNTVTNKVKLIINGTTYFLLASTSGV